MLEESDDDSTGTMFSQLGELGDLCEGSDYSSVGGAIKKAMLRLGDGQVFLKRVRICTETIKQNCIMRSTVRRRRADPFEASDATIV